MIVKIQSEFAGGRGGLSTLILAVFLALSIEGFAQPGELSARVFQEVGIDQKLDEQIPLDLKFRDEEGRDVALSEYFGRRPVILSLVYYNCPMLCTEILNGMVESFRIIEFTAGKEFEVVTVSIDPSETPELAARKKKQYVGEYDREPAKKGWHFLTGGRGSIQQLANAVGFHFVYDEKTGQFAHASGIMIATPRGKIARYLYGIEYGAKDLTFSLMEAAENRIGSPVNKLLLLCYHYDPLTGKYGVVVTTLIKAGGVLCVLLLGGYMATNFRRDRHRRQGLTV